MSCLSQAWRLLIIRTKRNNLAVVAQLQHTWALKLMSILLRWRGYASANRFVDIYPSDVEETLGIVQCAEYGMH